MALLSRRSRGVIGDGPGGSQIAEFGEVRPFLDIQALYDFGNEEVHVGVALPMTVGDHIHGYPIHRDGHVGAVVGVKTAQKDLFGFTTAGVLGDDEARHQLQHLMGRAIGPDVQVELAHGPRGGRGEGPFAVNQYFAYMQGTGGQGDDQASLLFRGDPHGIGEGSITDLTDLHLVGTRRHDGQYELTVHIRGGPQQGAYEANSGPHQWIAGSLVGYLAT